MRAQRPDTMNGPVDHDQGLANGKSLLTDMQRSAQLEQGRVHRSWATFCAMAVVLVGLVLLVAYHSQHKLVADGDTHELSEPDRYRDEFPDLFAGAHEQGQGHNSTDDVDDDDFDLFHTPPPTPGNSAVPSSQSLVPPDILCVYVCWNADPGCVSLMVGTG